MSDVSTFAKTQAEAMASMAALVRFQSDFISLAAKNGNEDAIKTARGSAVLLDVVKEDMKNAIAALQKIRVSLGG